jgi:hypothetical protein
MASERMMHHRGRAPPRIVWFILLIVHLVVSCNDATAEAAVEWIELQRHDVVQRWHSERPRRGGGSYRWKATVDRATGRATSLESSTVLHTSNLGGFLEGSRDIGRACQQVSSNLFGTYPVWLCRATSTFGLLRAVPHERNRFHDTPIGYDIRIRVLGLLLLQLGPSVSRTTSFANYGRGLQMLEHTVDLPITGGSMALKSNMYDGGSLSFTLQVWRDNNERQWSLYKLVTSIQGYRPALCGQSPVHPLRSTLYLWTQSIVHAHIMWRFHRYCCSAAL